MIVSVAVPVRNGGPRLAELLAAVRGQRLPEGVSLEIVVCDSGSTDGSVQIVRRAGAELITVAPAEFSHGGTRNLLMERSRGRFVAFLSQDAVPATSSWLKSLLAGFDAAGRVGLVFGPYRARPQASPMVRRELDAWFDTLSNDGASRVDRLSEAEIRRGIAPRELYGPRSFFTDANGCVAREAWQDAPFRTIAYAEDHALAIDVLNTGWAKVYTPEATVLHSHDYSLGGWLRRAFDEARATDSVYGNGHELGDPRRLVAQVRGAVGADLRASAPGTGRAGLLVRSVSHHGARAAGTALGARARALPPWAARRLSLE